jgi:hypothetical protein
MVLHQMAVTDRMDLREVIVPRRLRASAVFKISVEGRY